MYSRPQRFAIFPALLPLVCRFALSTFAWGSGRGDWWMFHLMHSRRGYFHRGNRV